MTPEKSRSHEDKFRCPQCGLLVTVSAGFRRETADVETLVRFDCSMEGMCGAPIWDPCPMYLAYMEHVPPAQPVERTATRSVPDRRWARTSMKEAW